MLTYAQQLKDPRWQRRRLERLAVSSFACDFCGDESTELHVHHPQYFKGRNAWEYADDELEVLCKPCHGRHHEIEGALKQGRQKSPLGTRFLDGLVAGFLDCRMELELPDSALADICPDARLAGAVASLFFEAEATTKQAIGRLLLADAQALNPAESCYLREYLGSDDGAQS